MTDENDKTRAGMNVDKDGPGMMMMDANGKSIWTAP